MEDKRERERNVSKEIALMLMERLVYLSKMLSYVICVMHSIPMTLNSSKKPIPPQLL